MKDLYQVSIYFVKTGNKNPIFWSSYYLPFKNFRVAIWFKGAMVISAKGEAFKIE